MNRTQVAVGIGLLMLIVGSLPSAATEARPAPRRPRTGGREQSTGEIMEAMTQRDAGPIDCNRNGINDSIDIAHGYDDDLNRNGKIDFCDPDARVREMSRSDQSWRQSRAGEKQSYFSVRMRDSRSPGGDIDVALVRYTLPVEALVTLSVRNVDESRVDTDLVNRRRQTGPIEMKWTQKLRGKYVPGGIYEFTLRVGPRVYKRRLAWAG